MYNFMVLVVFSIVKLLVQLFFVELFPQFNQICNFNNKKKLATVRHSSLNTLYSSKTKTVTAIELKPTYRGTK